MRFVEPRVFRLAATALHAPGVAEFLEGVGASSWQTDAPSDGEQLIEIAGRLCYLSFSTELNANLSQVRQGNASYLTNLIRQQHLSVLEHVTVSYALLGVSRVLADELKRHRHLSWSETSLRFVRLTDLGAYLPEPFAESPQAKAIMVDVFERAARAQHQLAELFGLDQEPDFGMKKQVTSAMRRCAPMGITTNLIVSGNLRCWAEIVQKRCTAHAEEEIAAVIGLVRADLRQLFFNAMGDL